MMTLNEAINYCSEKAIKGENVTEGLTYEQLAEWLNELKIWQVSLENVQKYFKNIME